MTRAPCSRGPHLPRLRRCDCAQGLDPGCLCKGAGRGQPSSGGHGVRALMATAPLRDPESAHLWGVPCILPLGSWANRPPHSGLQRGQRADGGPSWALSWPSPGQAGGLVAGGGGPGPSCPPLLRRAGSHVSERQPGPAAPPPAQRTPQLAWGCPRRGSSSVANAATFLLLEVLRFRTGGSRWPLGQRLLPLTPWAVS